MPPMLMRSSSSYLPKGMAASSRDSRRAALLWGAQLIDTCAEKSPTERASAAPMQFAEQRETIWIRSQKASKTRRLDHSSDVFACFLGARLTFACNGNRTSVIAAAKIPLHVALERLDRTIQWIECSADQTIKRK
jgi:hypothetical protein